MERALIGVDGNCGFALLGEDLQSGEAEFVEVVKVPDEPLYKAQERAATKAYRALEARLGRRLSYALDRSHPRYL